jgi:gamma-glutamylcyclotransferase (GGCT)/AIG2-like uncharacterized protein YtfP
VLYFAYGSNLDRIDRDRWCASRGFGPVRLEPAGIALLPDRRLAFTHFSATRRGGVLDVPPAPGCAVAGVLFRDVAWEALDRKEGEGHLYRRVTTTALTDGGDEMEVLTYEVDPPARRRFVAPDAAYLEIVRRGYAAFGLDAAPLLAAARDEPHDGPVRHVFVYGTLRRGECRHPVLLRHRAHGCGEGRVEGRLLDLGPYPTLSPGRSEVPVRGELYAFDDLTALIAAADRVEGFTGFEAAGSHYRRRIVSVARDGGPPVLAWTYLLSGDAPGARLIVSGDWRRREDVP